MTAAEFAEATKVFGIPAASLGALAYFWLRREAAGRSGRDDADIAAMRADLAEMRADLRALAETAGNLRERLARLEGKIDGGTK